MTAKVKPHVHDSMVQSVFAAEDGLEEWPDGPGYEGLYSISNKGKLYRHPRGATVKSGYTRGSKATGGYRKTNLSKDGEVKGFSLHALVMKAFVGECPEGKQIAHWDGIPFNNCLTNLRYATAQENADDKKRHAALSINYESHHGGKISLNKVRTIHRLIAHTSMDSMDIAFETDVSVSTVYQIASGTHWSFK